MKVHIGPYKSWIGPYEIADSLHYLCVHERDREKISDWLATTWVGTLCEWIHSKRERTIKVKIDPWDSWNADETMALVCLPVIKQLKRTKHGACNIADVDVPDHLKRTAAPPVENDWDTDANWFKRLDWVLDEIIWALENVVSNDWSDQFHHGVIDVDFVKAEGSVYYVMVEGPGHTHQFDQDGYAAYNARIDNGLRLLGTYWRGLWE